MVAITYRKVPEYQGILAEYTDRWGMPRPYDYEDGNGWAKLDDIKRECEERGVSITLAPDDGYTDGYVHWLCKKGDSQFELKANAWCAETFIDFMMWMRG